MPIYHYLNVWEDLISCYEAKWISFKKISNNAWRYEGIVNISLGLGSTFLSQYLPLVKFYRPWIGSQIGSTMVTIKRYPLSLFLGHSYVYIFFSLSNCKVALITPYIATMILSSIIHVMHQFRFRTPNNYFQWHVSLYYW